MAEESALADARRARGGELVGRLGRGEEFALRVADGKGVGAPLALGRRLVDARAADADDPAERVVLEVLELAALQHRVPLPPIP